MKRSIGAAFLFFAPMFVGCGGGGETAPSDTRDAVHSIHLLHRLQMNDVSILLPLAQNQADFDALLSASSPGRGGPLVPKALYDAATGADTAEDDDTDTPMPHAKLRLLAVRFDPCFANIGPVQNDAACENQMRVVFQPYDYADGSGPGDGALHVFYALSRAELISAMNEIAALREASRGAVDLGALAVHPVAADETLGGPFVTGLLQLIARYAGSANLIRFTRFREDSPNGIAEWIFRGFDVVNGAAVPMQIPALRGPDASKVSFSFALDTDFSPETSSTDDMQILADDVHGRLAPDADRRAAFDAALRIQNPNFHSPRTIDCASCHLSGPATAVADNVGLSPQGNPNAFTFSSPFVPPRDMRSTTPAVTPPLDINVHIFSWLDSTPMIATRAINETALIVDYLNRLPH